MSQVIPVVFHGAELFVIEHNGEPYTPMKPIVEGMGLTWQSQLLKLHQRFSKGITEIVIPSSGGNQKMVCLALRKLAAWLATISPNKVRSEIRDRVIQYQNECDDVLYEYWTTGEVKGKQPATPPGHSKVLLRFSGEQLISSQRLPDNYFIGPMETFIEVLKRKGLLVINPDDLKKIAY